MNFYFLSLMVYLVLILPLRVSFRLRTGRRPGYMLRVQAAGLPFYRRRRDEDPGDETPLRRQEMAEQLKPGTLRQLKVLLSRPVRSAIRQAVRMEVLSVYVHISEADAAKTALLYGALRTAALPLCTIKELPLRIHLRADHRGLGTEVLVRCIISLRLGSLFPAALAWLRQYRRATMQASKEEDYAASH